MTEAVQRITDIDGVTLIEVIDDEEEDEPAAPQEKPEDLNFGELPMKYLDKIRELCEKNNIQLILMKAPSLAPRWYDEQEEQVQEYVKKYDLPYINFYDLIDTLGIDYETDTYDGGLHMNLSGADKISEYLGELLRNEYGIDDHRSDKEISEVYEKKVEFYESMKAEQEAQIKKYGHVLD